MTTRLTVNAVASSGHLTHAPAGQTATRVADDDGGRRAATTLTRLCGT